MATRLMEDVIEIAALENDKRSWVWWSTVEDLLEVYEILSIPDISESTRARSSTW